jgi:hypothetical protein
MAVHVTIRDSTTTPTRRCEWLSLRTAVRVLDWRVSLLAEVGDRGLRFDVRVGSTGIVRRRHKRMSQVTTYSWWVNANRG